MNSTFLLHHSYYKLEFSDQGCHCLVEQNQPTLWETKGKEHPLFQECCSSKREAQNSAFPSYFLSELPLGTLCWPIVSPRPARTWQSPPWLLGAAALPRLDAEPLLRCSLRALGEPQPEGGIVISRCARPEQAQP